MALLSISPTCTDMLHGERPSNMLVVASHAGVRVRLSDLVWPHTDDDATATDAVTQGNTLVSSTQRSRQRNQLMCLPVEICVPARVLLQCHKNVCALAYVSVCVCVFVYVCACVRMCTISSECLAGRSTQTQFRRAPHRRIITRDAATGNYFASISVLAVRSFHLRRAVDYLRLEWI